MTSVKDIMQLCRLCLVKEQVNVPIFEEQGDLKRVIQKISACLPVKVSIEDKLPKKICDGCSYKLELLYQFRNATVNAEKQLLAWINQAYDDGDTSVEESKSQVTTQHIVKEEDVEIPDMLDNGETEFLLEQPIAFEGSDIPFTESQDDNDIDDDATNSSDDEPLAKRRRRLLESQGQTNTENSNQEVVHHVGVAKTEDASGTECEENVDDPDPNFISVGTDDIQQPGPSGLNKATADIPSSIIKTEPSPMKYAVIISRTPNDRKKDPRKCIECGLIFADTYQLRIHIMTQHWPAYTFSDDSLIPVDTKGLRKKKVVPIKTSQVDMLEEDVISDPLAILPDDILKIEMEDTPSEILKESSEYHTAPFQITLPAPTRNTDFVESHHRKYFNEFKTKSVVKNKCSNDAVFSQESQHKITIMPSNDADKSSSPTQTQVTCAQCNVRLKTDEIIIWNGLMSCNKCAFSPICCYCKKEFSTLDEVKIHRGESHFCKLCQKLYKDLSSHMLSQITCIICNVLLCNKKAMLNHYLVRHGKCWCTSCNLIFKDELDLYVHSRMKH